MGTPGWLARRASSRWALPQLLLAGLLLREAFAFWTGSPYDFEIWIRTGFVVGHGTDPYTSFWPPVPGLSIAYLNRDLTAAAYLPFWSLYTGASYQLYLGLGGGDRFVYYFFLKQGPIVGDVLTAWLLFRLVSDAGGSRNLALRASAFWVLFPYAILISAVWGQFDSIAVVVILSALSVREPARKNLLYGLGIFVKWVTAMFLPFEVFRTRGWARLWVLLALLVPLALTALVFASLHWGLDGVGTLFVSESAGIGGGMNWARWVAPFGPLSGVGNAPMVTPLFETLWIPGVVAAGWVASRRSPVRGHDLEIDAVVGIVAVFLLLRWGLNEQYLLYLFAPLLVDVMAFHRARRALFGTLVLLSSAFLVINNTLLVPFLSPLGPQYQAWFYTANNAPGWDPLRLWALDALAILITITLAQIVYVALRPRAGTSPWLIGGWRASAPNSALR
ncbi:MAG: hypothetical protein ACHQ0I_02720 [Candidatus Lutacidiplasmatales archaeon]